MSSELLKKIVDGEAFDVVEAVRELARVLVAVPIVVEQEAERGRVVGTAPASKKGSKA